EWCTADPGPRFFLLCAAATGVPGLQRTTSLRFVLRCARDTLPNWLCSRRLALFRGEQSQLGRTKPTGTYWLQFVPATLSTVVPAKAGTRNHRPLDCAKSRGRCS